MLIFNNGLESLDEVSFLMSTFLNIEENDACFFFPSSVIFLNADNVSEAFIFVTRNHEMITGYRMIDILRDQQNEVVEQVRGEKGIHLMF